MVHDAAPNPKLERGGKRRDVEIRDQGSGLDYLVIAPLLFRAYCVRATPRVASSATMGANHVL